MSQINPLRICNEKVLKMNPFTKVQQVGVDLTLEQECFIPYGQSKNVLLNEEVNLPSNIFAIFIHRSSYNRKGILITGSIYDPGYKGRVGCTIYNLSGEEINIPKDERIGQMVFFEADPASEYNGQWQNEHLK